MPQGRSDSRSVGKDNTVARWGCGRLVKTQGGRPKGGPYVAPMWAVRGPYVRRAGGFTGGVAGDFWGCERRGDEGEGLEDPSSASGKAGVPASARARYWEKPIREVGFRNVNGNYKVVAG